MRYGVATLIAALMLLAGIALAGAGHGWVAGAFGCFVLVPVSFFAVTNGLSRTPSLRAGFAILTTGLLLCLGVAIATLMQGSDHLVRYMQVNGAIGFLVAGSAYLGWLVIATLAILRARRVPRHST